MLKIFGRGKKRKKYDDYDEYDEYDDDEEYEDDDYEDEDDDYEDEDDDYEDEYEEDEEDDDYEDDRSLLLLKKKRHASAPRKSPPKKKRPPLHNEVINEDELDELQEENEQLQDELRELKAELRKNKRELSHLQNQVEAAHQTSESLENELSMVQAVPKDYDVCMAELEQVKTKYNNLLRESNRQIDETDLNRKKSERFANKVKQYEQELLTKQEEIDKLTKDGFESKASDKSTDAGTYEELENVRQELKTAKSQLAQKLVDVDQQLSKEDIGEVLLDAKKQAKEIINQANQRAQLINEETERKSGVLKRLELAEKEYQNYYKRIKDVKAESDQAFNQIINLVKEDPYH